jgi:hypothetical protein
MANSDWLSDFFARIIRYPKEKMQRLLCSRAKMQFFDDLKSILCKKKAEKVMPRSQISIVAHTACVVTQFTTNLESLPQREESDFLVVPIKVANLSLFAAVRSSGGVFSPACFPLRAFYL